MKPKEKAEELVTKMLKELFDLAKPNKKDFEFLEDQLSVF